MDSNAPLGVALGLGNHFPLARSIMLQPRRNFTFSIFLGRLSIAQHIDRAGF